MSAPLGYIAGREACRRYHVSIFVVGKAPSVKIVVDGCPRRFYREVDVARYAIEHHSKIEAFKRASEDVWGAVLAFPARRPSSVLAVHRRHRCAHGVRPRARGRVEALGGPSTDSQERLVESPMASGPHMGRRVITRAELRRVVAHVDDAPEHVRKWIAALIRISASDEWTLGLTDMLVNTDTRSTTRTHDTQTN